MGIRQRLAHWLDPPEQRSLTTWDMLKAAQGRLGHRRCSGQVVTPTSAESALATIGACVSVISGAISSLPALVYRWEGDRRVEVPTHPLQRMIDRGPTPLMTWADWCEWTVASVLLRGNAISEIVLDAARRLVELQPIPWDLVSIVELPGRRIAYEVSDEIRGGTRRLLQEQIFHLRDRNDDGGPVGVSRLQRAAGVVGNAQALAEFSGSMWRNSINPSGASRSRARSAPKRSPSCRSAGASSTQGRAMLAGRSSSTRAPSSNRSASRPKMPSCLKAASSAWPSCAGSTACRRRWCRTTRTTPSRTAKRPRAGSPRTRCSPG